MPHLQRWLTCILLLENITNENEIINYNFCNAITNANVRGPGPRFELSEGLSPPPSPIPMPIDISLNISWLIDSLFSEAWK